MAGDTQQQEAKRDAHITFRITSDEKERLQAAKLEGSSINQKARSAVLQALANQAAKEARK